MWRQKCVVSVLAECGRSAVGEGVSWRFAGRAAVGGFGLARGWGCQRSRCRERWWPPNCAPCHQPLLVEGPLILPGATPVDGPCSPI